jgi:hypothetical protein
MIVVLIIVGEMMEAVGGDELIQVAALYLYTVVQKNVNALPMLAEIQYSDMSYCALIPVLGSASEYLINYPYYL